MKPINKIREAGNGHWVWVEYTPEEAVEREAKIEEEKRINAEKWKKEQEDRERSAVAKEIDKLRKETNGKIEEADKLERLMAEFPDLCQQTGRWNKVVYASASVNSRVERFDIRHNCGCCADSPLEIWPYLETKNGNVHSNPSCFRVGEKDPITCHDIPYPEWDEKMKESGIPEQIINTIRYYFKKEAEKAKNYVEETFEGGA